MNIPVRKWIYWKYFKGIMDRSKLHNIECDFDYSKKGCKQFQEAIGIIPSEMKIPTVGRYDHNKGYVYDLEKQRWNFRWQEKSENSKEVIERNDIASIGGLACKNSPNFNAKQIITCPHCLKIGKLVPMKRWHFDNCKFATATTPTD